MRVLSLKKENSFNIGIIKLEYVTGDKPSIIKYFPIQCTYVIFSLHWPSGRLAENALGIKSTDIFL